MALYECPVCKNKNEENKNYCDHCGTWLLSDRFPAKKVSRGGGATRRMYVCSFCDTANDAGRNACKKCFKPLFSTDYETKEITVSGGGRSVVKLILKVIMYALTGLALLIGVSGAVTTPESVGYFIAVTIIALSIIQLIFGLVSPSIIPGKLTTRGRVFATYGIILMVSIYYMGSVDRPDSVPAVTTTAVNVAPPQEDAEAYKGSAKTIAYSEIARNPDKFKGEVVTFEGRVVQVLESGNNIGLRVNVTKGQHGIYTDTVFVNYRKKSGEDRILDNDIITIWGSVKGLKTYTSVLRTEISLPEIDARYLTINQK